MKGYLEQEGTPTPDNPVKIKTQVIGNNLFKTYEVNGRKYTDNLPKNALISIPKEQYIEYEQQKEEIERLNNGIKELFKENSNKEKVIKAQDNIIKEVREYINSLGWNTTIPNIQDNVWGILDKVGSDKE